MTSPSGKTCVLNLTLTIGYVQFLVFEANALSLCRFSENQVDEEPTLSDAQRRHRSIKHISQFDSRRASNVGPRLEPQEEPNIVRPDTFEWDATFPGLAIENDFGESRQQPDSEYTRNDSPDRYTLGTGYVDDHEGYTEVSADFRD